MGKGYAEGPALEERLAELEQRGRAEPERVTRLAVYGATAGNPERHFIGWLGEVDPDVLFASGAAWGLSVVRQSG